MPADVPPSPSAVSTPEPTGVPVRILLIQMLPIIVFLVVDAFVEDPAWAIVSALVFVVFQAGWIFFRQRRFEWLILVDTALIGVLGGISLISDDDLFFKLKPAILEAVMVPLFLFLALGGNNVLNRFLQRYTAGIAIAPAVFPLLKKLMLGIALMVALHAGVVVLAALYMSRQAWGWISGPGFYLLLVPMFLYIQFYKRKLRRSLAVPADPDPQKRVVSGRHSR
jgi:intracellular septation protein A